MSFERPEGWTSSPQTLSRWKLAARSYLEVGNVFYAECMHAGAIGRQRLDHVDDTRALFEELDGQYNEALDSLEVRRARDHWLVCLNATG